MGSPMPWDLATIRSGRRGLSPVARLVALLSATWMAIRGPTLHSSTGTTAWLIGIQTGGWKNCPPPSSANLAAKICGITDGATVTSPVRVKASGNSPAGVNQLQVWIDGKKKYVKWGDQLSRSFTLIQGGTASA